jgi:hypothetical protein
MSKDVLQITISKTKVPKTKLGKWFYWNIYFQVWRVWRPKLMAKIYWALSEFIFCMLPKSEQQKMLKEFDEVKVVIKNETDVKV